MRTTLDIDADVIDLARSFAEDSGISMGKALSKLARLGANIEVPIRIRGGFPVFDVSPSARPFGQAAVKSAEESDDLEYAKYFSRKPE